MTARQQWAIVLGVVALLVLGVVAATRVLGDELFPVVVGSNAPDFRARTLGPAPQDKTLADYRGEVVLLNIWATWCPPCREEMPSIERLHREFGPKGLKVVAVSIDDAGKEQAIRDFARGMGLTFELLHDAPGTIRRTYQTTGVPETFVIDREGKIRKKVIAATDWHSTSNRALMASLLGVPLGPSPAALGGGALLADTPSSIGIAP